MWDRDRGWGRDLPFFFKNSTLKVRVKVRVRVRVRIRIRVKLKVETNPNLTPG